MPITIVVPTLNEADVIAVTLTRFAPLRARGVLVFVVDGGSADATVALARPLADAVLAAPRGRAAQMNAGARAALETGAEVLLFVHADTALPADADWIITRALDASTRLWGRFDVAFDAAPQLLRLVAALMNVRSRATGVCTGDQAIFVRRGAFEALGGFAPIELMEDVEFCRRARRLSAPIALRDKVTTSARRWRRHGVLRTILRMWTLRAAYFLGADPARLARWYRDAR